MFQLKEQIINQKQILKKKKIHHYAERLQNNCQNMLNEFKKVTHEQNKNFNRDRKYKEPNIFEDEK